MADVPWGGILGFGGTGLTALVSSAEAQRQRDFARKMYKHRYQYQMEDMRKAGLNPILSYRQGAPGGPAGVAASIPDLGRSFSSPSSAYSVKIGRAQAKQAVDAARKVAHEANTAKWESVRKEQEALGEPAVSTAKAHQAKMLELALPGAKNQAAIQESLGALGTSTAKDAARLFIQLFGAGAAARKFRRFNPKKFK